MIVCDDSSKHTKVVFYVGFLVEARKKYSAVKLRWKTLLMLVAKKLRSVLRSIKFKLRREKV